MNHGCTAVTTPPEREVAFTFQRVTYAALLWWCVVEEVWDVIVYQVHAGEPRWQCSGVGLKRFVPVTGKSWKALDEAVWRAVVDEYDA